MQWKDCKKGKPMLKLVKSNIMKLVPADDERKQYLEIDGIRLIVLDGEIIGWYAPNGLADNKAISLNEWRDAIHENAVNHGWWESERSFGEIVALCHSELSEALEEDRAGNPLMYVIGEHGQIITDAAEFDGRKPEGVATELVDCMIRILDVLGRWDVDVEEVMRLKHEHNKCRAYKHGKRY